MKILDKFYVFVIKKKAMVYLTYFYNKLSLGETSLKQKT